MPLASPLSDMLPLPASRLAACIRPFPDPLPPGGVLIHADGADPAALLAAGTCVCIGTFDGVHLGHQALLAAGRERARKAGLTLASVTFEPHPLAVVAPGAVPARLLETRERVALLREAGAEIVLLMPFTPELAALPPERFVRERLLDGLAMRDLVLGYDFSMGRGRAGTPEALIRLGAEDGFTVERVAPYCLQGEVVSSTRIREALGRGEAEGAAAMLGRWHTVWGEVIHGEQWGRLLGFPTANLAPGRVLLPRPGVYATLATFAPPPPGTCLPAPPPWRREGGFRAVTNVGRNPTFNAGEPPLRVETHLLDGGGDLYGLDMGVAFVARLRDERPFSGPDALKAQIMADVASARDVLP